MRNKTVSIIVPIYNAEKTLDRCIISILNQIYEHKEIILVNDGSSDGTDEICKRYASEFTNIIVISEYNRGVSHARNVGLLKATGDYILFVDSDDYIDKNMCSDMVTNLERYGADLCMCTITVSRDGKEFTEHIIDGVIEGKRNIAEQVIMIYKTNYVNSPCNKLYKRELITAGFNNDISLGEDLLFNLVYLDNCNKIVFLDKDYYKYEFSNPDSLTSKYREDNFQLATLLYTEVRNYGYKHGLCFEDIAPVREVYMKMIFYSVQGLFYYNHKCFDEKLDIIRHWLSQKPARETCINPGDVNLQLKVAAKLMSAGAFSSIAILFATKKKIASLTGRNIDQGRALIDNKTK